MHIPDAAISPATSAAAIAAMAPIWWVSGMRARTSTSTERVPLLAVTSAFCFTIMMLNVPGPGGTTVHPVGGALAAVLLGPWSATVCVTVALAIQALFFGDGGVLAIGANCFAMAFTMPFCGYITYRALAGGSSEDSRRRAVSAAIGAYVGLIAAAAIVAVILGIQPALYHAADGHALYFPFGLRVTLPAILLAHMTVAGVAEAVVTYFAVRYLQTAGIKLYGVDAMQSGRPGRMELAWVALGVLIALTPLGLLARGEAWGEWDASEVAQRVGYTPARLQAIDERGWKGFNLLPEYLGERGPVFYIASAVVGAGGCAILAAVVMGLLRRRRRQAGDRSAADGEAMQSVLCEGEVPDWLLRAEHHAQPEEASRRYRADFVAQTLAGIAANARETVLSERWAHEPGYLQRVDPRCKVIGLLGLVVVAAMLHRLAALVLLAAAVFALAAASRIPLRHVVTRVWLTVPVAIGAVSLPALLSVVTPGTPLLVLARHPYVAVTQPGLLASVTLTTRVGVAVGFVMLLTMTTRWNDLLRALRVVGVPRMFVMVLEMTYRYLSGFMTAAAETLTALKSRTVGRARRVHDQRFVGSAMGGLFLLSMAFSDEVHLALVSRGWNGDAHATALPRLRRSDALWLAGAAALAALAVMV